MPSYRAPLNDMQFVLNDLLALECHQNVPGFEEITSELINAILEEGARISEEVLQPLNQSGDRDGCRFEDGAVKTPDGFKAAYDTYTQGGWTGLTGSPEFGGQGLPHVLGLAVSEMSNSANMAFSTYPGLTRGAVDAIEAHGSDDQKQRFLPKLISGEWSGTMNLTEPQCGTDLGMIRTKAEPQADGRYRLSGTKIFISAGEHDLAGNIVHLVLARIAGAPSGTKGISLFIVPKYRLDGHGNPGEDNGIRCGSIEKKMGIHASATCILHYEEAIGELIGRENEGLKAMFTMMNTARLAVGLQGLSLAEAAHQNAVTYARDRLQGRSLSGVKSPDLPADPIIVHPDVRRLLMNCRAFCEGARALCYWAGLQVDLANRHPDPQARQDADDLLGLLTPVVKAYLTDKGFDTVNLALQCFGGHGYVNEWGMEQFVRDARITQIYEGANGIQALDLVGRKLAANNGRAVRLFFEQVNELCDRAKNESELAPLVFPLEAALGRLRQATAWFAESGRNNPDHLGAGSTDYLHLMGLVALGYSWAQMAERAHRCLAENAEPAELYRNKLVTAHYFMERMLPDTIAHLERIELGADNLMALEDAAF